MKRISSGHPKSSASRRGGAATSGQRTASGQHLTKGALAKSTLGPLLAEDLELPFIELNCEIERVAGYSVREIQDLYGGAAYRRYERLVLEEVFQKTQSSRPRNARGACVGCRDIQPVADPLQDHSV